MSEPPTPEPDAPTQALLGLRRAEAHLRDVMRAHVQGHAQIAEVAEASRAVQDAKIVLERVKGPEIRGPEKSWGGH